MSEEEKEKIYLSTKEELEEFLKPFIKRWLNEKEKVDRLQKENEELKEDNEKQWEERCRLTFKVSELQSENEFLKAPFEYANGNTLDKRYVEMNFVSKDKIKDKIKELKEELEEGYLGDDNIRVDKAIIEVLEDLLKEN